MGISERLKKVEKRRRNYFLPILVSVFSLVFSVCFLIAGIVLVAKVKKEHILKVFHEAFPDISYRIDEITFLLRHTKP
jgi:hypothetical protein